MTSELVSSDYQSNGQDFNQHVEPVEPAAVPEGMPPRAVFINGNGVDETGEPETGDSEIHASNGAGESASDLTDARQDLPAPAAVELPDDLTAKLGGFSRPASDCINKARRIARELNHSSVSAAHLVLAMTLDPRATRRLRDQGADVDAVRETAVQLLAKYNCLYSTPNAEAPTAAPDLADILESASRYAKEREDEEEITISDLLDAFPKAGSRSRLIYGQPSDSADQVLSVVRRVEQSLVPQITQLFQSFEERLLESASARLAGMVDEAAARLNTQLNDAGAQFGTSIATQLATLNDTSAQLGAQIGSQIAAMKETSNQLNNEIYAIVQAGKRVERPSNWPWSR